MSGEPKKESWFKAMRSNDALELIRKNPNAYALAATIAIRANYRAGFNAQGLAMGEALLGDHTMYGMTRQKYRTALSQLEKSNFITTKKTNAGTIAKLIDTRLFEICPMQNNQPKNQQTSNAQPTHNQRPTTNIDSEKYRKVDSSNDSRRIKNANTSNSYTLQ